MNKILLVWNIVITIALVVMVVSGCATLDPQYASMVTEVQNHRSLLEQVINLANQNQAAISSMNTAVMKNTITIANLQSTTEAAIAATDASLRQYVQQYVQAYVQQAK
jgi:hypothetical protein